MKKYGLHGKLNAIEGKGEELANILLEAAQMVTTAKGCLLYLVSRDKEEEDCIWITEVWESEEDHDNSLKLENVRKLIGTAIPLIDGKPEKGQELEVVGGTGLRVEK